MLDWMERFFSSAGDESKAPAADPQLDERMRIDLSGRRPFLPQDLS
jgi:hypothetical protein